MTQEEKDLCTSKIGWCPEEGITPTPDMLKIPKEMYLQVRINDLIYTKTNGKIDLSDSPLYSDGMNIIKTINGEKLYNIIVEYKQGKDGNFEDILVLFDTLSQILYYYYASCNVNNYIPKRPKKACLILVSDKYVCSINTCDIQDMLEELKPIYLQAYWTRELSASKIKRSVFMPKIQEIFVKYKIQDKITFNKTLDTDFADIIVNSVIKFTI